MTVIKIENLWKEYRLGIIGHGALASDLNSWWARVRGKEDPNSLISLSPKQESQIEGETFWALRDINLEVKYGQLLGIIGKNGAGKSTLLKILSRVTAPSQGCIKVKGRIASLLEVGTGFHPELTGKENIFLNGAILGMSKPEIRDKLDEIVDFSGVENFINTPVKRYSSGMYVRLAFAVAAHLEPEILIVDEVLAVGDAEFQKKCLGKMGEVSKEGRTVLFVSHNMGMLQQLCSDVVWFSEGMVKEQGESRTVISNYLADSIVDVVGGEFRAPIDPHKQAQLTMLRILDHQGKTSELLNCDNPFELELTITIHKKTRGLYGYLSIMKKDQTPVMVSDSFDTGQNNLDALEPGEHIVRIRVPERTLAAGFYFVYLNFTGPESEGENIDSPGCVASFELNDLSTKRGNNRQGFFSTILEWQVES